MIHLLLFALLNLQPSPADVDPCTATDSLTVRNAHAMTYHHDRAMVMLFGGADERQVLNDMWAWDGQGWHQIHGAMPPARAEASLAYDSDRQRLVLFGGYHTIDGEIVRLGDTWSYNGTQWVRLTSDGPAARNHTAMVYDAARNKIVLFGGHDSSRVYGDTWEWKGRRWVSMQEQEPRLRVDNGH